jgi:hypothetical protein
MTVTMELVRFRVTPGREEAFVAGRDAALAGLRTVPGMLSATLARADDGTWIDVILWASKEDAMAADAALQAGTLPGPVLEWASAIEEVESMTHAQVAHQDDSRGQHTGPGAGR